MMKNKDKMNGFTVINKREIKDCKGVMYEMVHDKTGAKLVYLDRNEINKTFAITFKTEPQDDTGVFHILEHSVLNGSDKFPVKEPFVELLKGSMQTFLNAITFDDKTMFPVSSRNDKDFMNLVNVYLDGVLHPAIYRNPNIFYQEGWHYEIRDTKEEPVYKGVVLNEMKGAFSSVDELMVSELKKMLFPDNGYKYCSGGEPAHITDLSYEQFLNTHRKYYHPSNAQIFLDGKMDLDAVLALIDSYFSGYEKENAGKAIEMQRAVPACKHTIAYEVTEEGELKNRTQICMAKTVSSYDQIEKNTAWQVLSSVLVSNNESPLKKAVLDKGLGESVELELYDGIQQPWAVLTVRNTDEDKYDEVMAAIKETAASLVENGLDHDQLAASLNQMEFHYSEKHEPSGLMYGKSVYDAWLYGGDPASYLNLSSVFESLRKKIDEGYFEELLKEFLLSDDLQTLAAVPSTAKAQEREKAEQDKLANAKKSWGSETDQYVELNQKLDEWQQTPDTQEQLSSLPKLTLEDVSKDPFPLPFSEAEVKGVPVILHPSQDNGIVYMTYYFSLAGITREYLPTVGFYSSLLGLLPTENMTVEMLQQEVRRDLGGISFFVDAYSPRNVHDSCIPVIGVNCSVLKKNLNKAVPLILEIMQKTVFDKDKIRTLLKQDNEDFRQGLIGNGQGAAIRRVSAHSSAEGVFREYVGGYASGLYEKDLEEHYDEKIDAFLNECEMYTEVLFSKNRMTASITGEENLSAVEEMIAGVHDVDGMRAKVHYPLLEDKKEFIQIPAGISYSAEGGNITDSGMSYEIGMQVMSHILTYQYLWNEVRVKGGSYGTGFAVSQNGNCTAYSYRDPDVKHTMLAYQNAGKSLQEIAGSEDDMTDMIIGTIAGGEPLMSPSMQMSAADIMYFRGVTEDIRKQGRRDLLAMNNEKLGSYCEALTKTMDSAAVCVVGNDDALEKCRDEGFKTLEKI